MRSASSGLSGAKVVLVMFGATLAIALIAVAAYLLTDEAKLLCVEGELQDNQVDANGQFIPRTEEFDTFEEAEAFICHRLPYPRETSGMQLQGVVVTRTTNLGELIEGTGSATVALGYGSEGGPERLTLAATLPVTSAAEASIVGGDAIMLGENEAMLLQSPGDDSLTVIWDRDNFHFVATAALDDDLTLETLLTVLESVR
jgi:hypothetical protein